MKKKCELCNSIAKVVCESDQAALCWDCDSKIHASNFLFAKHLRSLLCNSCHSPTSWTAAGPNLSPTLSFCHPCAVATHKTLRTNADDAGGQRPQSDHGEEEIDDDGTRGAGDCVAVGDDDDEDNQVVPLSFHTAPLHVQDPRRKFNRRPALF